MKNLVARLVGFSTLPFISAVLPLVALPIVARVGGVDGWGALAVGQAVGAYAAAVGFVGWNVLGTPLVATEREEDARWGLYARSFSARAVVVALIAVPAMAISALLAAEGARAIAAVFALGGALGGLGISWFAVGISSVALIVNYEVLPRVIGTGAAIGLVLVTGDVFWYGACLLVSGIVGLAAFHLRFFRRLLPKWSGWAQVREDVFGFRSAWGVEVVGNLYANAPVPAAAATGSPASSASYASSDRIYRYGLMGVVAAGNALQGWVLEIDDARRVKRNLVAIGLMAAIGLIGLAVLAFAGVPLSRLLFGADVQGDSATFLWLGLAFFAVSSSTPLIRNVLMPARRENSVLVVTIVSALLGLAAMFLLPGAMGVSGVAAGLALSESVTLIACVGLTLRVGIHARSGWSIGP